VATCWYPSISLPRRGESGLQTGCCRVVVTAAHNSGEGSPPVMSDRDAAAPLLEALTRTVYGTRRARRATHVAVQIAVQPSREKYSTSNFQKKCDLISPSRPIARGVSRSSRTRGGLWWTRRCRVREVIAERAKLVSGHGLPGERRCCGWRSRVVLAPHGRRQGPDGSRGAQPGCEAQFSRTDGGQHSQWSPGRARIIVCRGRAWFLRGLQVPSGKGRSGR